jgi:hypothetical protein
VRGARGTTISTESALAEFAPHGFSSVTLDRDGSFLSADLRRGCGNCVVSPKYSWGRMELAALRAQQWQKGERREVRARVATEPSSWIGPQGIL